jgi:hypothetical protein
MKRGRGARKMRAFFFRFTFQTTPQGNGNGRGPFQDAATIAALFGTDRIGFIDLSGSCLRK